MEKGFQFLEGLSFQSYSLIEASSTSNKTEAVQMNKLGLGEMA